jgi:hypothetical protein
MYHQAGNYATHGLQFDGICKVKARAFLDANGVRKAAPHSRMLRSSVCQHNSAFLSTDFATALYDLTGYGKV